LRCGGRDHSRQEERREIIRDDHTRPLRQHVEQAFVRDAKLRNLAHSDLFARRVRRA
jgi:hypothetical protein